MTRDLNMMGQIMDQKDREINAAQLQPLDQEGIVMAKHKRFTIDMVGTPTDPLR